MKKVLFLLAFMAVFVIGQAGEKDVGPPGVIVKTLTVEKAILQDNQQLNFVQYGSILFNIVNPVTEFSNYLTYELSANYALPDKQQSTFKRWYPLSAGGIAYRYSNGPGKLLNINLDGLNQYSLSVDKTLAPETNKQVWLINCNIKTS